MANMTTTTETFECFECDSEVECKKISHSHDEAPDFYRMPDGAWMGQTIIEGADPEGEEQFDLIVLCSEECVAEFFKGYES